MGEPILNFSTIIVRPIIQIDGQHYEIRAQDECSLIERHRLSHQLKSSQDLFAKEDLSDADKKRMQSRLDDAFSVVAVGVPKEIAAHLSDDQKMRVIELFLGPPIPSGKAAAKSGKRTGG